MRKMSYSLNSLKGGYIRDYIGTIIGVIEGYTRSLDSSSDEVHGGLRQAEGPQQRAARAWLLVVAACSLHAYIYIYIYLFIFSHMHTHTYIYIYCVYIYMLVTWGGGFCWRC